MLQQLEQDLDRFTRGLTQKGNAFEEADGKAPPFEWGKVWEVFKVVTSMVLDFVPIVGNIKGLYEALTGRDLITGAELSWYERALALAGPLGKGIKGGAKFLKASKEVVTGVNKIVKVTNTVVSVVDDGKGIVEAITGVDMLTGEKLKPWQRLMGLGGTAVSAGMGKVKNKKDKLFQAADEVTDGIPKLKKVDSPVDSIVGTPKAKETDLSQSIGDKNNHGLEATAAATTVAATSITNKPKERNISESIPKEEKGGKGHSEEKPHNQKPLLDSFHIERGKKTAEKTNPINFTPESLNGDPVHVGTGQQFIIHSALKLHGASMWDFQLLYNSSLLQQSVLGLAWSHNYDMRLDFSQNCDDESLVHLKVIKEQSNVVTVVNEDIQIKSSLENRINAVERKTITVYWNAGRRNIFHLQSDGVYRATDADVLLDELTPIENGYELRIGSTRERFYFNEAGVLQRHVNRVGMALQASYDKQGLLQRLEDVLSGRTFQFTYEQGLLVEVADAHRKVSFAYDKAGWLAELTDAINQVTTFTCDGEGRILTMSTNGKRDLTNVFDEYHRVIKQIDAKDNVTTFEYDAYSRPGYFLTTVTNRAGEVEHHVYNDHHKLLEIRGEEGVLQRYTYNEWGQKLTESNALGETTHRTYDKKGQLIGYQDALGQETTFIYNEAGLLIEEQNALGAVTTYAYDAQERLITMTRPDGVSCHWEYNDVGQLLAYHNYAGETVRYNYKDNGYIEAMEDGEGHQTIFLMDEVGRMAGMQDVHGGTLLRTYNDDDKLTEVKDALGRTWQYRYNLNGEITEITDPAGATTSYTYTATNKVATVTNALGHVHRYTYDGEDRLIAEEDARGGITKLCYDARGRVSSVTDALNRSITYSYDVTGRLHSVKDALGQPVQTLTYDVNGQPIAITNALGHTTHRRFNALYQPMEQTEADGIKTEYHYDELARLQEVVQDSEQWRARYSQSYDAEHRLTKYKDANGNETILTYNRSGQVIEEKNSTGHGLSYAYDERGWLKTQHNARGQQGSYTYDAAGQLICLTDEVGQIELKYDEAGRWIEGKETRNQTSGQDGVWKNKQNQSASLHTDGRGKEESQSIRRSYDALGRLVEQWDVWGQRIGYTYDEVGNLTHLTYPDGKVVEYRYNLAGELTEVKDWTGRLTRYRYDGNGRVIETHRPNGTRERRSYDALGQLLRQQDATARGIMLQDLKYEYNEVGQIVKEQNKQYTYDQLRRLISGANQGKITYYRYDLGGNLTDQKEVDSFGQAHDSGFTSNTMSAFSYSADNRLRRIAIYPTEHDADGNLLYFTDGEKMAAYEYDARNRLIQTGRMKYRYNWRNERIESIWRGKVTRYVVDDSSRFSRVLMELDGEGNATARYIYGLGLIGREDAGTGMYHSYHSDLRGSTTILTNEYGLVTDRYAYGTYGEVDHFEGNTSQPFQYNGRDGVVHDVNGLYYMRARYYHSELKRFLNRDIIQGDITDGQTFNRYSYVNGNPVKYIDPLGLSKLENTTNVLMDRPLAGDNTGSMLRTNELNYSPSNYPNPDPPMSAPPVRHEPSTFEEVIRMRQGKGPTTKATHGDKNIEAHHRQQIPVQNGGILDELEQKVHRGAGNHTRHQKPSNLTPAQRAKEIREHYKKRGSEYMLPGEGI
jgi:RHS repeat-associated protein